MEYCDHCNKTNEMFNLIDSLKKTIDILYNQLTEKNNLIEALSAQNQRLLICVKKLDKENEELKEKLKD